MPVGTVEWSKSATPLAKSNADGYNVTLTIW